jgi:hypothetical protein
LRISLSTLASSVRAFQESGAMLHPQPIQLAHVLSTEVFEEIPPHQLVAECDENPFFHLLAADGQAIGARAT